MAENIDKVVSLVEDENFFAKMISVIGKTTEADVAERLKLANKTVGVAESLTGGLVSAALTNTPGSSDYFIGGIVCYSNRSKVMDVGVPGALIAAHGPVSREVAGSMAECVKKKFRADIGLSATGVAGPATVSPPKPVGLTYIGLCSDKGTEVKELQLFGTREEIRKKAAQAALGILWFHLGGDEKEFSFK